MKTTSIKTASGMYINYFFLGMVISFSHQHVLFNKTVEYRSDRD